MDNEDHHLSFEDIEGYVQESLPDDRRSEAEVHLASCDPCVKRVQALSVLEPEWESWRQPVTPRPLPWWGRVAHSCRAAFANRYAFALLWAGAAFVLGLHFPTRDQSQARYPRDQRRVRGADETTMDPYRTRWALLIGIDDYSRARNAGPLENAVSDVEGLREALVSDYQFLDENVTVLTNETASRDGIEQALAHLMDSGNVSKRDCVLVYFSGHGQTIKLPHGEQAGYLVPHGAAVDFAEREDPSQYEQSCLAMDDLTRRLHNVPAKHVLLLIDACYSGLALGDASGTSTSVGDYLSKVQELPVLQAITAGREGDPAVEGSDLGHGAFTSELLKALDEGAADANADNVITGRELGEYLRTAVSDIAEQVPQFGYLAGTGEFLFLRGRPPDVARVEVVPDHATLSAGDRRQFTARAYDRRGAEMPEASVQWSVVGGCGDIDPDTGTLTAGGTPGKYTDSVRASVEGRQGTASVTVIRPAVVLPAHSDIVFSVAFSPKTGTLASASWDGTVKLWMVDLERPRLLRTLAAPSGESQRVVAVAFGPHGNLLASGGAGIGAPHDDQADDSTEAEQDPHHYAIRLWDAGTGKLTRTLGRDSAAQHTALVRQLALSPDGSTMASASDDTTIKLWNVANGSLVRTLKGHEGNVYSVCFSPTNGDILASGSADHTVRLWEADTGRVTTTLAEHEHIVRSVAFSPDGRQLASASYDGTVRLWDVPSGKCTMVLGGKDKGATHSAKVLCAAFSPDGNTVASGSADMMVRLWDAKTGRIKHVLEGHEGSVTSLAFCQLAGEGRKEVVLASASNDGALRLWPFSDLVAESGDR